MASTKVMAVVAIVVIAVVAIAAFVLINNNSGSTSEGSIDTALAVYGNANNDSTIDKNDIAIINDIIDNKKSLKDYPFADANCDKVVDSKDIDVVNSIINKKATSVKIQCLDPSGNATVKDVAYPLVNIAVIGTNMVPVVINAGAVPVVAGWYEGSTAYPVLEKEMKDNAYSLGKAGRTALSDELWKNFTDRSAALKSETGIGIQAFFVDHSLGSAITQKIRDDLAAANIPEIRLAVADPYKDISSVMMVGFLAGGEIEETARKYVDASIDVLSDIEKKLSKLKDGEHASYIGITMSNYICQTKSTFGMIGSYVAGTPYGDLNDDFADKYAGTGSTVMSSFEALSNYAIKSKLGDKPGIDVIFSNRSIDFKVGEDKWDDTVVSEWEKSCSGGAKGKAMDYFKDLDCYDRLWYINNLMPGACKLAYAAAALYPDLYAMEDAEKVVAQFSKVAITMSGVTPENSTLCFGLEDYNAAKAA